MANESKHQVKSYSSNKQRVLLSCAIQTKRYCSYALELYITVNDVRNINRSVRMDQNIYELIRKKLDKNITESEIDELLTAFMSFFSKSDIEDDEYKIIKTINAFETIGFYEHKDFFFEENTYITVSKLMQSVEKLSSHPYYKLDKSYIYAFLLTYNNIVLLNIFKKDGIAYTICKEATFANLDLSQCDNPKYVCQNNELISQFINKVLSASKDSEEEEAKEEITVTDKINPNNSLLPTDKVNRNIWSKNSDIHKELYTNGAVNVSTASWKNKDRKEQLSVPLMINTTQLQELKDIELNSYDFRVYRAIHAIAVTTKSTFVSLYAIYKYMAPQAYSNMSKFDKEKIKESIQKMRLTLISINNRNESGFYKYAYFNYDNDYLLPCRFSTKNGVEGIRLYLVEYEEGKPELALPLIKWATVRNQIEQIPLSLYSATITRNETSEAIEDYLIREIFAKKKKADRDGKPLKSVEISLDDIYKECGVSFKDKNRKQKIKRIRDRYIQPLLEYWTSQNYLTNKSCIDLKSKKLKVYFNNKKEAQ